MRGKNQEEKQQEIQTHKQERSTWHVSILPAISIIREGQWNFEILWGRKISHCEKVFANSFWNTTSAIVAGLELVQDKSAWRKGRLRLLLLSKLSSHIWLLSILFAEWDTSDISLVEYQLDTSKNFRSFVPPQFGFVHIVIKICGLHSAKSHNKIFWSIKSIATDFELHQYNSSECQEGKNVMPKDKQTNPNIFFSKVRYMLKMIFFH